MRLGEVATLVPLGDREAKRCVMYCYEGKDKKYYFIINGYFFKKFSNVGIIFKDT